MISIIIPAYNARHYLNRCLTSIVYQTYRDWECIIVDDGSSDDTYEYAKKLVGNNNRFFFMKQENRGVSEARNAGLAVARGEMICFVDADDWCEPTMLALLVAGAKAHPEAGRIAAPQRICDEASKQRFVWDITPTGILKPDNPTIFAGPLCDVGHVNGNLYVKKLIPFEPSFPRVPVFEDMIFNMGLVFAGVTTFVLNTCVYNYTRRRGSLSAAQLSKFEIIKIRAALDYQAGFYSPDEELYNRFSAFLENAIKCRNGNR